MLCLWLGLFCPQGPLRAYAPQDCPADTTPVFAPWHPDLPLTLTATPADIDWLCVEKKK
jgi:hypothetical protein